MAEWSIAAVLKTVDCQRSGGSNPSLSAASRLSRDFFMPFYTYILRSLKDNGYYYGHTSDLEARLKKHNDGKVRSTKSRKPFVIHYLEVFSSKAEAYRQEMLLKSAAGKMYLRKKGIIWDGRVVDCGGLARRILWKNRWLSKVRGFSTGPFGESLSLRWNLF